MIDRATFRAAFRVAFVVAAMGAYILAIAPGDPEVFSYDKWNHVLAFGTMAGLARLGWSRAPAWVIAALLTGFGAFIEISQALPIVHRDASWLDLLADALALVPGLIAGMILLTIARKS